MYYKFLVPLLAFFVLSIWSQEYEITSESVEIDTSEDLVIYSGGVKFASSQINFTSNKLIIDQKSEKFFAEGNPIYISYVQDADEVTGSAQKLELIEGTLSLKGQVKLIRNNNKISSDSIIIKLQK